MNRIKTRTDQNIQDLLFTKYEEEQMKVGYIETHERMECFTEKEWRNKLVHSLVVMEKINCILEGQEFECSEEIKRKLLNIILG